MVTITVEQPNPFALIHDSRDHYISTTLCFGDTMNMQSIVNHLAHTTNYRVVAVVDGLVATWVLQSAISYAFTADPLSSVSSVLLLLMMASFPFLIAGRFLDVPGINALRLIIACRISCSTNCLQSSIRPETMAHYDGFTRDI